MLPLDTIRRAPKVLLHDHLDGGLRPTTVIDLAREFGYANLPTEDPEATEPQEAEPPEVEVEDGQELPTEDL